MIPRVPFARDGRLPQVIEIGRSVPYNTAAEPSPTEAVMMLQPPPELAGGRKEVWIAAGGGEHWGGCEVWASVNDESYDRLGFIDTRAAVGVLASPLAAGPDPDTQGCDIDLTASRGQIHPGNQHDADLYVTASAIGKELIAYSNARLIAPHVYTLGGYLRRGLFGSPITSHAAGESFVRLNGAMFRTEIPAHFAGHTVHVKLPAFNEFRGMTQTLDRVKAYDLRLAT